jgi:hypothetical protein
MRGSTARAGEEARQSRRLVLLLAEPGAALRRDGAEAQVSVTDRGGKTTLGRGRFPWALVEALIASGAIEAEGAVFRLGPAGRALALRLAAPGAEDFAAQHRAVEPRRIEEDHGPSIVRVNLRESPLLWLSRRRGADGAPLIEPAHLAAGERLRATFERAALDPRTTIDWSRLGGGDRSSAAHDPADSAIAARAALGRALDAVGPEGAGLLMDVCCFLKGLEDVERDRRWPARSARVALGFALAALARHYGIEAVAKGPERSRGMRRWSADSAG